MTYRKTISNIRKYCKAVLNTTCKVRYLGYGPDPASHGGKKNTHGWEIYVDRYMTSKETNDFHKHWAAEAYRISTHSMKESGKSTLGLHSLKEYIDYEL